MLTSIGDLLNWAVAAIVFPLMFLPLAALIDRRPPMKGASMRIPTGATIWFFLVVGTGLAAILFANLAPRLSLPNSAANPWLAGAVAVQALAIAALGGPTRITPILATVFASIARGAGRLVMWLALAMALIQFGVVILRYVFGINSIFMQESITYMHGAVFLVAAGYALLTDDHVRVDIFYRAASPKRKALVNLVGTYLFLFPVILVALWTGSEYVGHAFAVREGSTEQSGIQGVYLLKALVPTFAILLAMAGFSVAARAGETLRGER